MIPNLRQLVEYRELLRTLVLKDIRSRYKGSVLGFAWNFAIPLLQLLVFWVLFGVILKVPRSGDYPFAVFLFTGLLPWNFVAASVGSGTMSILGSASLVKKIYFPLQILPLANVLAEFIALLLGMIVLAIVILAFGVGFSWHALLLPLAFAVLIVFMSGFVYLFACANVFYRDVGHILGIVVMAWMYLTPILYPVETVAGKAAWANVVIHLNPMTGIITTFQRLLLDHQMPDWFWFGYSAAAAIIMFVVGFGIFNRYKFHFEEEV